MEQGEISLSEREFARIKGRVYQVAGISLSDAKRTLVISRLSKIVRALGLPSFDAYIDFLERKGTAQEGQEFVNALTTNLTRFYREDHHFDHLRKHIEALVASKPRGSRLRIWSAGCSTGQEPYTIGMDLLGAFPELKRWDFKILATDIDTAVIEKAARGIYPENELNGLSRERAAPFGKPGDGTIVIPEAVRNLVSFKPLNLIGPWPMKGPFDAVFCRNVAIYFDKPTQGEVFGRFSKLMAPEGYLYIGHSENLGSGGDGFRLVGKTIYQSKLKLNKQEAA
ncbi:MULTISPECIES: protein-glutamate O-methyltransferase [Devosia]|jgi:chemotaxis protein methyltransferase CheR|uniref:Chemotaxis protein methyltransferase n=1 Tax=Devosia litorisediminis TaxID=2829817 RepID=A0A942I712_9HYPH|nr:MULTISPECIES: protein-glutamate O-methyltransferase [Devosia]MBS3850147.1 protein-glutamate O-methyltransferase [Devosia litorisediminis]MCZ4347634.1 protein-glutamate O-methyltransferase [Devosia neptuniae]|tara:strand:- start:5972 stop:6817 length:846 start_codon:yes stop_codon:yes gene_type:complete